jgi:hypothetical protein
VDVVDSTTNALTLSIAQATAGIDFTATDSVTVNVTGDTDISALTLGVNVDTFTVSGSNILSTTAAQTSGLSVTGATAKLELKGNATTFNAINVTIGTILLTEALSASITLNNIKTDVDASSITTNTKNVTLNLIDTAVNIKGGAGSLDTVNTTLTTGTGITSSFVVDSNIEKVQITLTDTHNITADNISTNIELIGGGAGTTTLTGVSSDVDASNFVSGENLSVTLADTNVTITTGAGTNTINADALSDGNVVTILGNDDVTVSLTAGDVDASGMSGIPVVTINGGTGSNVITTAAGDDIINLSSGDDNVATNSGSDVISIDGNSLDINDVIDAGVNDTDVLSITANGTLIDADFTNIRNFETLDLTANADSVILSTEANNAFSASSTVNGNAGNDDFTIDFSNLSKFILDGGNDIDTVTTNGGTLDSTGNTSLSLNANNIEILDISSLNITNTSGTEHLQITQADIQGWTDIADDISLTLSLTQDSDVELVSARIQGSGSAYSDIVMTTADNSKIYEFADTNVTLALTIA